MRRIAILGSTGSIGKQAISVALLHKDQFKISALCANTNSEILIQQARMTGAKVLGLCRETKVPDDLKDREWIFGEDAAERIAALVEIDDVLDAIVGIAGLSAVLAARKAGKRVLLANKESLVAGGALLMDMCHATSDGVQSLLPVDSEHSAIFQCIQGEEMNPVEKIWLTASGGPFRTWNKADIRNATVEQALGHPTWSMGRKITVDSASMFNKALEIIEAKWLFGVDPERISVVIHPQSIIHSMVEFSDGAIKAQLGVPDMRVPILYAMTYPHRMETGAAKLDIEQLSKISFEAPDTERFPSIPMAYDVLRAGGTAACTMNAANEIAVNAFLTGRIRFGDIYSVVSETLNRENVRNINSIDDIRAADRSGRVTAQDIVSKRSNR